MLDLSWLENPAAAWVIPDPLDLTFEGFAPEAFGVLDRLREHPHIEQYRKEKEGIQRFITGPFKQFRDDLVVNWVLPNRLGFETEKNVFSRLLKNDFGAGGCHHHLWMAFYRHGRRRLTDAQLAPCITPNGFTLGLFIGGYMTDLLKQAKANMAVDPARFLDLLNPLLHDKKWKFCIYQGQAKTLFPDPLERLPGELAKATGLFIRSYMCREEVLDAGAGLVRWSLDRLGYLWPIYQFMLRDERTVR